MGSGALLGAARHSPSPRMHRRNPPRDQVLGMLEFLKREFTLEKALSKVLWTILFAGLTRAVFWLLNISLAHKELWFWLIVPASYLAAIIAFRRLARGGGPQIAGEIEWIHISEMPPASGFPPGALVAIIATVRNLGEATSLEAWTLNVEIENQPRLTAIPLPCGETFTIPDMNVTLSGADELHAKLANRMLDKGERIRGLLIFDVTAVAPITLGKPGQVYTLSVEDYERRRWPIKFTWKAQLDVAPRMFPGMKIAYGTPPAPGGSVAAPHPAPPALPQS